MAEIVSSGSVDFTDPNTPESGVLADFAAEQAAAEAEAAAAREAQALETARMQWAEAVAKDERAQNTRHAKPVQTSRHTRGSRGAYLARQDWQRTVRGVERQVHSWNSGHHDGWVNSPGKGQDLTWYRDRYGQFVADVVGFWRAFWYGQ